MSEQVKAAAVVERAECLCGCGGFPAGKGGRFLPGHDGRLKGQLLKVARGADPVAAEEAAGILVKFGWGHFLIETAKERAKRQRIAAAKAREAEKERAAAKPAPLARPAPAAEAPQPDPIVNPDDFRPREGGDDPTEAELEALRGKAQQRKAQREAKAAAAKRRVAEAAAVA